MSISKWKLAAVALTVATLSPRLASADACECVGGPYPPWAAPPPAYAPAYYAPPPQVVVAPMFVRERRIGIGVRATGMSVVDAEQRGGDEEPLGLSGGGLFMRFRGRGHFGLELAVDGAATEDQDSHRLGYQRVTALASASLFYRFMPRARFDWHVLIGVGGGSTELRYGADSETEPSHTRIFNQSEGHVGVGFEWKLGRRQAWVVTGDLRFLGLHTEEEEGDHILAGGAEKTALIVSPIPENESGATAHFGIGYYF